jgi:hypothetical protein
MADDPWPFDQERRCAVVTLRSIVFRGQPVLLVFHDKKDDGWQFLDGQAFEMSNAAVVALEEVVKRDPAVLEIADLPPGWKAWRESPSSPWQRAPADDGA